VGQLAAQETGGTVITNRAGYSYDAVAGGNTGAVQVVGNSSPVELKDARGHVRDANGALLPDYTGFTIGVYQPGTGTGKNSANRPVEMTPTTAIQKPLPDTPTGVEPNNRNENAYPLANAEEGTYTFVLDAARGQLEPGFTCLLVVNARAGSGWDGRRIRITIGERHGDTVDYTATALDGLPIYATGAETELKRACMLYPGIRAEQTLAILNPDILVAPAGSIRITKTGDRASAEIGDSVVYRVAVKNTSDTPLDTLVVTDVLPAGFDFTRGSVRSELDRKPVEVTVTRRGSTVQFEFPGLVLAPNKVVTIAYAALLTPSALGSRGINSASVAGRSVGAGKNNPIYTAVKAGPVTFQVRVNQGRVLTDAGTILGRVFVDRNGDGEQQENEPGVGGAVVFLDDGTRIVADAAGLFSVPNVQPGPRTAVLDLLSVPGFKIARNRRFIERNSPSRLVRLEPGGTVRINFGVTPVSPGEQSRR
jgi:uncharacterized repeat protein (TIGR01451 family)